ncbi:MAG: AAA family ATPase [Candidatus Micrarchaeia archaeon]
MIESIELKNWKTHNSTTLHFQKGVNVLIGIMGAGKSSVLDAISFALFGTFPTLNSKRVSLSNLITNRPKKEDNAKIILTFSVDGDTYKVIREITPKGSSAKLEKNGVYLQAQSTKVTEEVERLLKIDYDTFSRVIYSEQNGLDYFLNLTKTERKREIDHMLGLDSFSTAEENTITLINNIRASIEAKEENIAKIDKKELINSYQQLVLEKENIEKENEKLRLDEEKYKLELEKQKSMVEELKKKLNEKIKLDKEISNLQGNIANIDKEIKKLNVQKLNTEELKSALDSARKKEQELKQDAEKLNKNIIEKTKDVANIESNINDLSRKIKEKQKLEEFLKENDEHLIQKKLDDTREELNNAASIEITSIKKIEEINETLKELKLAEGKCPVCGNILDDEHKKKLITEKQEMILKLNKAIEENKKKKEENKNILKELEEKLKKVGVAKARLNEYKDIDVDIQEKNKKRIEENKLLEELQLNYNKIKDKIEELREPISKLEAEFRDAKRLDQYKEEYKLMNANLIEKQEKAKSINIDEKEIYTKQDYITKSSNMLTDIQAKLSSNMRFNKTIEEQLKGKKKELENFEDIEKEVENGRNIIENLNKFKAAIINTEATLRSQLVSSINELMLQLWPRLYPYMDYSAIRINAVKEDYLLEVNTSINNEWLQVDGIASGGERSIACLIMRIALAMVVVPNLKWIILDEPTHNIDSNGITKLIDILGNELPNIVEQIFIITHEDSLKQINQAKIYQLERDKNNSLNTKTTEV